jgi:hypothetical protein
LSAAARRWLGWDVNIDEERHDPSCVGQDDPSDPVLRTAAVRPRLHRTLETTTRSVTDCRNSNLLPDVEAQVDGAGHLGTTCRPDAFSWSAAGGRITALPAPLDKIHRAARASPSATVTKPDLDEDRLLFVSSVPRPLFSIAIVTSSMRLKLPSAGVIPELDSGRRWSQGTLRLFRTVAVQD